MDTISAVKNQLNPQCPAFRQRKSVFPMIDLDDAIALVLNEATVLNKEVKSLKESHSFVLAEPVVAPHPYPSFRASIKDGYAVIAKDSVFENNETAVLKVLGSVTAGCTPNLNVSPGTCIRVNTGGIVPDGADAVVQIEDTKLHQPREDGEEASIEILSKPTKHQDIRDIGSDVAEGELLLADGKKITAAEIGIMSTFGINRVTVHAKPKVAVFSTGDEIVEPDCPDVQTGYVRDSNKNTLCYMLHENSVPFIDAGIVKDNSSEVKHHLSQALQNADIVITTGGVSMGEKDILKQVLMDMGAKLHFGRVKLKPGKPTTFFTVTVQDKKKFIFALPGNPVSACVCFYLFVIPCIKKMMGYSELEHKTFKVKLGHDIKLDERPECQRAVLNCGEDGVFIAQRTGAQQSSRLPSMHNADALLMLPGRTDAQPVLKAGTFVKAIFLKSI